MRKDIMSYEDIQKPTKTKNKKEVEEMKPTKTKKNVSIKKPLEQIYSLVLTLTLLIASFNLYSCANRLYYPVIGIILIEAARRISTNWFKN
jgi:hypothetical protein